MSVANETRLEQQIRQWRSYLQGRQAIRPVDVQELEAHLRDQIESLISMGLTEEEAFLVGVRRMGAQDQLSQEFAREHSDRLWKQLVVAAGDERAAEREWREEAMIALLLAAAAAASVKLPALFGFGINENEEFYARNASFFVLPALIVFFAWKRDLSTRLVGALAAALGVAAVIVNVYPFRDAGDTEILAILHLPIALWLAIGIAYAGARWWDGTERRMDFVRFSGELFIYFVLIGLGGGVLMMSIFAIFSSIGVDPEPFVESWLLPCGAVGAVIISAWLVEAKQSVVENMAPVLTKLFTPLFTAVLLTFLATMLWTGRGIDIERNVLIAFDLLLVLVLALLLYSISARDTEAPPGPFDYLLVTLLISALLVDALALAAIAARISDFGFTPNRVAALGENVILLVNLAWSAHLYLRFLSGRGAFRPLERWQTGYLPVYSAWAAVVVVVFPVVFGFR